MTFLGRMWAYVTLGAMGIVVEEASPLMGGLAAHDRHLRLSSVILAVALGTWTSGFLLYLLGRWRGRWLRKRWPRFRSLILRSVALVRRHPWRASIAVRWAWGLRLPLPIACGVSRVPILVFSIGSAVSSLTWSLVFSWLGWWLGETILTVFGHVRKFEPLIGLTLVVLMVIGAIIVRRRHVADRAAHVIDPDTAQPAVAPEAPPTP
ncbi:MAG TPA: VTT domain-containing protein [Gemmatimonadaceae bacterium]|nr:VTT domain-containing protein [Gemmatimonadaceae bacterium]